MKAIIFVIVSLVILVGIGAWYDSGSGDQAQRQAAASAPAIDYVAQSMHGCKNWTETHSKLGVGEIVDIYQIEGKGWPKLKPGQFRVGLDYRAQGSGLLMRSVCEYQQAGTSVVLVKANSEPQ